MWPLCFISDKLFKVAGDGGEGPDSPPPPDGQIPLARQSYCVDVPHVQQACTWDCGLACVLMVLRTLGIDCCEGIADLEKLCRTTSIWTVDLAYLLHKFSVSFSFFTVTLGANPQYSAETFYREQLQEDIDRVDELFGKALDAGISIQCRSISAYDIAFLLLSGHCIAIALVDKTKLNSSWTSDVHDVQQFNEESDYMGHYVVICGYDADACEFEIRDPASSRKRERVPMKSLDEARKSFGTDEDILLALEESGNDLDSAIKSLLNLHLEFVESSGDPACEPPNQITTEVQVSVEGMRNSVALKRFQPQLFRSNWKLMTVLKGQMAYLEEWSLLERDYADSLSGIVEALTATILCLPVTDGAKADIQDVQNAVGSAVDNMQTIGSSICTLLAKLAGTSILVSDLAKIATQERTLMEQSRELLSTLASMHVKYCSLQGQRVQTTHRRFMHS